jgi:GNAT superfamily N-acetyltransferase
MNDAASVTVRAATADDAERFAVLLTDEGYPAGASDLAARITRFSTEDSRVLTAEASGEVIGFVAFHVLPRFETDERFARIVALVVDPGVRARGIGRQLMIEAERIAAAEGAAFLEVTAGHHRPDARKLFESLGYDAGLAAYLRKRP